MSPPTWRRQMFPGYKAGRPTLQQRRDQERQRQLLAFDPPLGWAATAAWPCCPDLAPDEPTGPS